MNRQEIMDTLAAFPYDRNEYWVITGAAMVLYGIREQTGDIDLGCTAKMADLLEADGFLFHKTDAGKRWFKIGHTIEVFEEWLEDSLETIDGLQIISIKGLIEMKQRLGREKDLRDIERIKDYLRRYSNKIRIMT